MPQPEFVRTPLLCPKCQGSRMINQDIHEMYEPQRKGQPPLYSAHTTQRVICATCQVEVWPQPWISEPAQAGER